MTQARPLNRLRKSHFSSRTVRKEQSHQGEACKPGWTESRTGCTPASGGTSSSLVATPKTEVDNTSTKHVEAKLDAIVDSIDSSDPNAPSKSFLKATHKKLSNVALELLARNMKSIAPHGSPAVDTWGLGHDVPVKMAGGMFDTASGKLHIAEEDSGVYIHELGHAIDMYDENGETHFRYSNTPEWKTAWEEEAHVIGHYATTQPYEGFAEMLRFVSGWKMDKRIAKSRCKKSYALFLKWGLLNE